MSYVRIIIAALVANLLVGCAHYTSHNPYSQPSPVSQTMRYSGGTIAHLPTNGSLKSDPFVTLESSVKQAAPVEVAVTFIYRPPRRNRESTARDCMVHIKTLDSSLSDVVRCKMKRAGNSFIVTFKPKGQRELKSFDLLALGGHCQGGCPFYFYSNGFVHLTLSGTGAIPVKYVYRGPDPFQ